MVRTLYWMMYDPFLMLGMALIYNNFSLSFFTYVKQYCTTFPYVNSKYYNFILNFSYFCIKDHSFFINHHMYTASRGWDYIILILNSKNCTQLLFATVPDSSINSWSHGFESSSSPAHGKLCYSLGGLLPRMAQYRVLASEGRQRYLVYTKKNLKKYIGRFIFNLWK
jgi:hypothetical protein